MVIRIFCVPRTSLLLAESPRYVCAVGRASIWVPVGVPSRTRISVIVFPVLVSDEFVTENSGYPKSVSVSLTYLNRLWSSFIFCVATRFCVRRKNNAKKKTNTKIIRASSEFHRDVEKSIFNFQHRFINIQPISRY